MLASKQSQETFAVEDHATIAKILGSCVVYYTEDVSRNDNPCKYISFASTDDNYNYLYKFVLK